MKRVLKLYFLVPHEDIGPDSSYLALAKAESGCNCSIALTLLQTKQLPVCSRFHFCYHSPYSTHRALVMLCACRLLSPWSSGTSLGCYTALTVLWGWCSAGLKTPCVKSVQWVSCGGLAYATQTKELLQMTSKVPVSHVTADIKIKKKNKFSFLVVKSVEEVCKLILKC